MAYGIEQKVLSITHGTKAFIIESLPGSHFLQIPLLKLDDEYK